MIQLLECAGRGAVGTPRTFEHERVHYMLEECISSIQSWIRIYNDMGDHATRLSDWVSSDDSTSPTFEPLADLED